MGTIRKRMDTDFSLAELIKMLPVDTDYDKIMICPRYDAFAMYDYQREAYIRIEQVD
jgi:hypothetical protein